MMMAICRARLQWRFRGEANVTRKVRKHKLTHYRVNGINETLARSISRHGQEYGSERLVTLFVTSAGDIAIKAMLKAKRWSLAEATSNGEPDI